MNTHESGNLYRSGRFSLRRKARPVRSSPPAVPLAQRRWLLPSALGVLAVGVLAGGALAALGLPLGGPATLTPAHAVGTPPPDSPLPGLADGPSPSPSPGQSASDPASSPSATASDAPAVPAVGMLSTAASQCLDIAGTDNGAPTLAAECDGADQQRWQLTKGTSDQYVLADAATGKCLAVENGSRDDGARILHSDCQGGAEQRWLMHWQSDAFTLVNVNSGMCAAVEDNRGVRQHPCGEDDGQRWSVRD